MLFIATIVVIAVCCLFLYNDWRLSYWYSKGVLTPKSYPFVGHVGKSILSMKHNGVIFGEIYSQFKSEPYVGVYIAHKPAILIRDPKLIECVLSEQFDSFHDNDFDFDKNLDPLLVHNAFAQKGNNWMKVRSRVVPTFTTDKMRFMFSPMANSCEKMIKYLDGHLETTSRRIDMKQVAAKYTSDLIASCAFGLEAETFTNPKSEFLKMTNKLNDTSFTNTIKFILKFIVPALTIIKIRYVNTAVSDWIIKTVAETVKYRQRNNVQINDYLQILINLKNREECDISDCEITGHSYSFLSDGFKTSSSTLAFACYEVAKNEHVQTILREQVNGVLDKYEGVWTYEALQEMDYLERVVHETLRKYPPYPVLQKRCTQEIILPKRNDKDSKGIRIDVGSSVLIPVYGLHRDPVYFPNPDKFDPDRFTENEKLKRSKYTYLGFGEGTRQCLGMKFGLAMTMIALANMVRNYNLKISSKTTEPIQIDPKSFILSAKSGLWIKLNKR